MRIKLKDVAQAAGVSVGTVSRVLNDNPTVAAPIRQRVEDAVAALGYRLDPVAQSMRGRRSRLVACAIRDFDLPRFGLFIKEAERVLRAAGYTLLLSSTANSPAVEIALLRAFQSRKVEGVMMTVSDERNREVLEALAQSPVPVLAIDRDRLDGVDRVAADHRSGAAEAVAYLLRLGHRRIAMLVGDTRAFPSRSRVEGFRDAYAAFDARPEPRLLRDGVLTHEDAQRETIALMGLPEPPTAIFVAAMDMLGGCLRALRDLGCPVGRCRGTAGADGPVGQGAGGQGELGNGAFLTREGRGGGGLALVAGSDSELAELYDPPITAIAWDLASMGRHAATMLLARMGPGRGGPGRGAPERSVVVPTQLVLRDSCPPPPEPPAPRPRRRPRPGAAG